MFCTKLNTNNRNQSCMCWGGVVGPQPSWTQEQSRSAIWGTSFNPAGCHCKDSCNKDSHHPLDCDTPSCHRNSIPITVFKRSHKLAFVCLLVGCFCFFLFYRHSDHECNSVQFKSVKSIKRTLMQCTYKQHWHGNSCTPFSYANTFFCLASYLCSND